MKKLTLKIPVKRMDSKIYFSKETERRIFFFMTLIMLGAGIVARLV